MLTILLQALEEARVANLTNGGSITLHHLITIIKRAEQLQQDADDKLANSAWDSNSDSFSW